MTFRALSPKQQGILDFLFEYVSSTGQAPTRDNFAIELELSLPELNNVATTIQSLSLRGLVRYRRAEHRTRYGHGKILAVIEVSHPRFGLARVHDVDRCFDNMGKEIPCLCCASRFMSAHKFNRLCPSCSMTAAQYASAGYEGGYISNGLAIFSGHVGGMFIRGAE